MAHDAEDELELSALPRHVCIFGALTKSVLHPFLYQELYFPWSKAGPGAVSIAEWGEVTLDTTSLYIVLTQSCLLSLHTSV